jgi:hypothetical protein
MYDPDNLYDIKGYPRPRWKRYVRRAAARLLYIAGWIAATLAAIIGWMVWI